MIKRINYLKNWGIFKTYNGAGLRNFEKYNLIYGWNGSGKSTLSNLFRSIEIRNNSEKFPLSDFSLELTSGATVTKNTLSTISPLKIYTFNNDFIEENISWNNIVKSILLIDKSKITERERLETLTAEQKSDNATLNTELTEIKKIEDEIAKFGTASARRVKTSLQTIDTTDAYYLNYNKTKFEQFITRNNTLCNDSSAVLDDAQLLALTTAAKPNQKSLIAFNAQSINIDYFNKAKERLDNLLQTSVISQTIQRLIDHSDIRAWVETGLALHSRHSTTVCEYCGNGITEDRIKYFEAHFNDDYKRFQDRLAQADQWLPSQYINNIHLPSDIELYDEFKIEYSNACSKLNRSIELLNERINTWRSTLNKKIENPLETTLKVLQIDESLVREFNITIESIRTTIGKHNHKCNNFKEETTKAKNRLELHFASTEISEFDYYAKKQEVVTRTEKCTELRGTINKRTAEIQKLEDLLSNESLGADKFNEDLHKFLGRSELTLRFNSSKRGYEILRNESELVNGKLSEGEKTAIAFVYFITKLKENNNKPEDTIVVVDDPVSSFDSNHLFHAYSFLRSNCEKVKQLFVFTHNFTYFKLIRDWFDGVNKNRTRKNPPKEPVAFFFTIEASSNTPRYSTLKEADSTLINYNSEYHYIFSRLYKYKENPSLSRDDAFLTANLARKLLESFFSFKFPKHRGDIAQLMQRGLTGCQVTDESIKEKIYRFINKYSHNIVIEVNDDSSENLAGESVNVITDIFNWLKEVDVVHYNEMVEVTK